MRVFEVQRLFELGSYKNIKFTAGVEVGDEDTRSSLEIFGGLVSDVYQIYFDHDEKLKQLNLAKTAEEKKEIFK